MGVSYLEFDDLQAFDEAELPEIYHKVNLNILSEDWKVQYDTINLMRVLNKHHRNTDFILLMGEVAAFVHDQVDNLRSNLMKNSLMFVKEVAMGT